MGPHNGGGLEDRIQNTTFVQILAVSGGVLKKKKKALASTQGEKLHQQNSKRLCTEEDSALCAPGVVVGKPLLSDYIPLSTEGTLLSGSALRGTIRATRVASKRAARAARAKRKQHTHHAQNAQNAQHGVLEADLEADFRHAQNA